MKSLLIVSELFHPSVGGQEIRYRELACQFLKNGWRVDVVTIASNELMPAVEMVDGITVRRLVRDPSYQRPHSKLRRNLPTILKFSLEVRRFLREQQFDVIIFSIFPMFPQLLSRVPPETVTVMDWCEHRSSPPWQILNRLLARSTSKHMAISEGVKDILTRRYKIQDIISVAGGIFVGEYSSSRPKSGVLFFGRITEHKRPAEAIEAVMLVRNQGFAEHLTVAGGGPLLEELKTRYGHLEYIHFLGRVSDEIKQELFATHKIYLLPSIREGFPRTVAEAMASGTPTITTQHTDNGTVDVINRYESGMVVAPGAASIAEAIIRLTTDKEQWNRLSVQCVQRSRELDWQNVYKKLVGHLGVEVQ